MSTALERSGGFKLLVLEAKAENLSRVRDAWPEADILTIVPDPSLGIADLISRERVQVVICELVEESGCSLNVLEKIRRVHPHLPLIAVLQGQDFSLGLSAFRHGADDLLVSPLETEALCAARDRVLSREKLDKSLAHTHEAAKRSLGDLILLKAIGETARSARELPYLLDRIVDLIQSSLDVEIVSLMLVENDGSLKIRSSCGLPDKVSHQVTIAPGEGVSGYVALHGEPILIDDLSTDGRFPPRDNADRYRSGSLLSVPIRYQERTIGVLNVNNKRKGDAFTSVDQDLLLMIADQAALAIENVKLVGNLKDKNLEVEQAHNNLVKLHQDRTRFVCNLSHELKTPLTSVLGFSDLLINFFEKIEPQQLKEYIQGIYSEGKHLEYLLNGMLRLFSLDSGSEHWNWQSLPLRDSLDKALLNNRDELEEKALRLDLDIAEDVHMVWADLDKLDLLFDALIDNAVKFNRPEGLLSVRAANLTLHDRPVVYVQVANQGESVPRESSEDIFHEYSQLGTLDAGKPSGVGIGLATCRAILRQMKGEIFLEPVDDEGTSFGVLLPTSEMSMEMNNG